MSRRLTVPLLAGLLLATPPLGAQDAIEITVEGGKHDLKNVPVCVPLSLPKAEAETGARLLLLAGSSSPAFPAQLGAPGLTTESIQPSANDLVRRDLHFVVPELKAGRALKLLLSPRAATFGARFHWDNPDVLVWSEKTGDTRMVLKYMRAAYDATTPAKRDRTYKVFHHLFDPHGKRPVTNGGHTDAYTDERMLLYPHHRGLMFAFNQISYGDDLKKTADTWHAKPGDTHEQHEKFLGQEAGPVLGRHRVLVSWHGAKNEVFATEERELTVYNIPGGTLVEFAAKLKTAGGKVRLDGDPQHAGFQFRAANEVSEKEATRQKTYFLRPDGKGKPGETRNWDPKTREGPVDLPWDAMSFVLGGQRYTVCYLNSPNNPKDSRFSERDYGRFGCYFAYDLAEDHPLVVNYRVWLQEGEMTGDQAEALYEAFAHPPAAEAGK
jgi:hypothetical protein